MVFPPIAPLMVPSGPWVEATARGARAFASGRAMSATAGISPATVALAESALPTTTLVPAVTAAAIFLTACLALLAAVPGVAAPIRSDRRAGGSRRTPGRGPGTRRRGNRALVLHIVERETKAPLEAVEVTVEADSGSGTGSAVTPRC